MGKIVPNSVNCEGKINIWKFVEETKNKGFVVSPVSSHNEGKKILI